MFELSVVCPEGQVDLLSQALEALDALSVSMEDFDAATAAEQALFGEPDMPQPKKLWPRSLVKAHFADESCAVDAETILAAQDFFQACTSLGVQPVPDHDWVRLTQAQFAPVQITPEFWIVPTWHEPPAGAVQVITLDPGLAFGTGTHPTTRMCLRWIAQHAPALPGQRVLDYGCGSGILAIGAARYGAVHVDAVDIDPAAVASTQDNARANRVSVQALLPDQLGAPQANYAVVFANILARPLKVLAPLLSRYVALGGQLVLAGILDRQERELQQAYAPYAKLQVADREDGWILMSAQI